MKPGMKVYSIFFDEEYGCFDLFNYEFQSYKVISSSWEVNDHNAEVEEVVQVEYEYGGTTEIGRKFLLSGGQKKVLQSIIQKRKTYKNKQLWKFVPETLSSFNPMKIDFVVAKNANDASKAVMNIFSGTFSWTSIEPYDGPKKNKSVVMKVESK